MTARTELVARIEAAEALKDAKELKNAKAALRRLDAKEGTTSPEAAGEPTQLEQVEAKAKAQIAEDKKTGNKPAAKAVAPKPEPKAKPADVDGQRWGGTVRETKTYVQIVDRKIAEPDTELKDNRWAMICTDHAVTSLVKTFNDAWTQAAHPLAWCKKCQKAAIV